MTQRDGRDLGRPSLASGRGSQAGPLVDPSDLCASLQDGRLSKAEILSNWNMFVGSQATNYGEDLTRHHDEL